MLILLTGGSGMVGKNFLSNPDICDYEILAPTSSELNLCNKTHVENYVCHHKPDLVIHAAGLVGGIQANLKEPIRFLVDNLEMGSNVVLAAQKAGVKRLINLGSSCMYPRNFDHPLAEEEVLSGELEPTNEGYALAKIVTARLCRYISQEDSSYQYKTLIPCNLYGAFDEFAPGKSHLVPAIIDKIYRAKLENEAKVQIWGSGDARREFMFASDFALCLSRAVVEFASLPPIMNVGLGCDYTINEYYETVATVLDYEGEFYHDLTKPEGMKRKLVDISKQIEWGWTAPTSLADGVRKTFQFYMQQE